MKAQLLGLVGLGPEALPHDPRPEAPRRAELGDLLDHVVVTVEEEAQLPAELVHVETSVHRRLHVGDPIGEGESHLLHGGAAGLAHVVARDGDRVEARHLLLGEREDVADEPERRPRRKDVRPARDVLLEDVVLNRATQGLPRDAPLLADRRVECEQDRPGGVDGHRGGDRVERQLRQQAPHVVDGVDRHPHPTDLARRFGVVAVVAHLRGQVEGDAEAGLPLREQVAVALVGLVGRAEAGVLPHRPQPSTVHVGLHPAREGGQAGKPEIALGIEPLGLQRFPVVELVGVHAPLPHAAAQRRRALARLGDHLGERLARGRGPDLKGRSIS